MKKTLEALVAALCIVTIAGCGGTSTGSSQDTKQATSSSQQGSAQSLQPDTKLTGNSKTLVVYFSFADNAPVPSKVDADARASRQVRNGKFIGNAGLLASWVADAAKADTYDVQVAKAYPTDYDDTAKQAKQEAEDNARPELAGENLDLSKYDTIYIVFPNWWGNMPMAMESFFDKYDFAGKTIIPVITHGGSGWSDSLDTMKKLEPNATIKDGLDVHANSVASAQDKVNQFVAGQK